MAKEPAGEQAEHVLRVALTHPECTSGEVIANGEMQSIRLNLRVAMPLHMAADGISESGVRVIEPVTLRLLSDYPWIPPVVEFRADFPRDFPHLLPVRASQPPRPCLVDGDQTEFFLQFGLVEYGIFQLIEQIAIWLRKAAVNTLIDPAQGWEPILRHNYPHIMTFDAGAARNSVTRKGGWAVWKAIFVHRQFSNQNHAGNRTAWLTSSNVLTPLTIRPGKAIFGLRELEPGVNGGHTVIGVIWPDKLPDGSLHISGRYLPESVENLGDLCDRATELGCRRSLDGFLSNLERSFVDLSPPAPVPIGIVLCARRPCHLIGSDSDIELLPYVLEVPPGLKKGKFLDSAQPVGAALHLQSLTAPLLRDLSGLPERTGVAILGCGSVGSKIAMHAARCGQAVVSISDQSLLRPHNVARHALSGDAIGEFKADALAAELQTLACTPSVHKGNLATDLRNPTLASLIIPKDAGCVINTTAALSVREALDTLAPSSEKRFFEAALFSKGRIGYLLAGGKGHNPSHSDLMAELYATLEDERAKNLMFDPVDGLTEVMIGQGCGSLTMRASDAQLSMMTAGLALEWGRVLDAPVADGLIALGIHDDNAGVTRWLRTPVEPFTEVQIEGSDDWSLRISSRVASRIRKEARTFHNVETGGVLIGLASARTKTVTAVDLIDAPSDSTRSASRFVLGTNGLHEAIQSRHHNSGRTLFDIGTWHSHIIDEGPSNLDRCTAAELAAERTPPAVLLIATPTRFHALVSSRDKGAKRNF